MHMYYAILHKPSNTYLPVYKGGQRRGSTYLNAPFVGAPRLFGSKLSAQNCLRWWLGGPPCVEYEKEDDMGTIESRHYLPGKGVVGRNKEDMEIVVVDLVCR